MGKGPGGGRKEEGNLGWGGGLKKRGSGRWGGGEKKMSHKLSCTCGLEGRGGLPPRTILRVPRVGSGGVGPLPGRWEGEVFAAPEAGLGSEQSAS